MIVDVAAEERYWYPHDGGEIWMAGYQPVDAQGRFLARDADELRARGLLVLTVAGAARHHGEALERIVLGEPLLLRRDPSNAHDPNAIRVERADGEQVGWVPREDAEQLAPELDAGTDHTAIALREARPSPRDPRTGLTMLVAPAPRIELRVR